MSAQEGGYFAILARFVRSHLVFQKHSDEALSFIYAFLQRVPQQENHAFHLDNALIHQAASMLLGRREAPDRFFIPVYGKKFHDGWGHQLIPMPVNERVVFYFHYIFIPREENVVPHLETYAWLVHEVVHYVFSFMPQVLGGTHAALDTLRARWTRSSLAVGGSAGQANQQLASELQALWTPVESQLDWPHEIAVDLICVWVLGPVYIDALVHSYENPSSPVNPFVVEQKHIPLELRAAAMLRAGEQLGWSAFLGPLRQLHKNWKEQWPPPPQGTQYRHLRQESLINAAQADATRYCTDAGVSRLTPDQLEVVKAKVDDLQSLTGIEVIIAAWWKWKQVHDEAEFDAWVQEVLETYADDQEDGVATVPPAATP